jgi:hypothetical protein
MKMHLKDFGIIAKKHNSKYKPIKVDENNEDVESLINSIDQSFDHTTKCKYSLR